MSDTDKSNEETNVLLAENDVTLKRVTGSFSQLCGNGWICDLQIGQIY